MPKRLLAIADLDLDLAFHQTILGRRYHILYQEVTEITFSLYFKTDLKNFRSQKFINFHVDQNYRLKQVKNASVYRIGSLCYRGSR